MRSAVQEGTNVKTIRFVKEIFHQADTNGGDDLDIDEFATAFKEKLHTEDGSDEVCVLQRYVNCIW